MSARSPELGQPNFDGASHHILRPDHSCARIADVADSDVPQLMLACTSAWYIEGVDVIMDCTAEQLGEPVVRPLPKVFGACRIAEFLRVLKPDASVSFEKPP
jgi:hypothetical protein